MAHGIDVVNGHASMFYVKNNQKGNTDPWHRLGTPVAGAQVAEDAIKLMRADWDATLEPTYAEVSGYRIQTPAYAIVRQAYQGHPPTVLGTASERYKIVQNRDAFKFFDRVVGEGKAIYETGGVLFGGKQVWVAARFPESMVILPDDQIDKYFVLLTSHDGTLPVQGFCTSIRPVCNNTVQAGIRHATHRFSFRHRGDIGAKWEQGYQALGLAVRYFEQLEEALKRFTEVPVTAADVKEYATQLLPMPTPKDSKAELETFQRARVNVEMNRQKLHRLVEVGRGTDIKGVRGTAYGLYQAAVELSDHHLNRARTPDAKLASKWHGTAATFTQRAFDLAANFSRN